MERNDFIRQIAINGGLITLLPTLIIQACEKDDSPNDNGNPGNGSDITLNLDDPQYAALMSEGSFIQLTANKIIVINIGNNEFTALSNVCTHEGCTVGYNNNLKTLPCPCHGSVFKIDGSVLNGPAGSPLRIYNTSLDGNILTINI